MKIVIPDLVSNSYFPSIAAVELGFFKQEGLDVELELVFPVNRSYEWLRDGKADFVGGEKNVSGNIVGTDTDLSELMVLAQAGKVTLHTKQYPLEAALDALHDLDAGNVRGRAILVP